MIGRTIGKYRIVGQLGRGGAGIVYKAIDETLHRDVAIKTLNPDLANTEVMKRFKAEATILAQLNHPQIATIYDLFRDENDLLMVMEFVRGETLDKLSARLGPMAPDRAAYLVDQILSGLEHAHRAGIVHRDMKPANVMVTDAGHVKIMDFGIARVRGAEQMTMDGRLMGTPAYMPPEQVLGQEVDGRADLYSTGVVLYRLLTGALPFTADTALAMLQRQILETPLPLDTHRTGLPEWCNQIVQRALAKSPADRFQTAEEFREVLARETGPLAMADLTKTFASAGSEGVISSAAVRTDTLNLSRLDGVEPTVSATSGAAIVPRNTWAYAAMAIVLLSVIALAYVVVRRPTETAMAATAAPPPAIDPKPTVESAQPADRAEPVERPDPVERPEPVERTQAGDASHRQPPVASEPLASEPVVPVSGPPPAPMPSEPDMPPSYVPRRGRSAALEPLLIFETKALFGTKKPREHDAQLVLSNGKVTVTPDIDSEYPLYSIPYESILSITYSHGRDPMWISPEGPAPITFGGGTLGRFGVFVSRDWISLRTTTKDQFIAMRFDEVLVRRVLLALEERTGRSPHLMAQPRDTK